MFCITAVIFVTDSTLLGTVDGDTLITTFMPIDNTTGLYQPNSSSISQANTDTSGFGSGMFIIITDILRILAFATTIQGFVTVTFAPAMALQSAEAPIFLVLVVGGIWLLMYILAFVGFMRGRDV